MTITGRGSYDFRKRLGRLHGRAAEGRRGRGGAPPDHRAPRARRAVHEEPRRGSARRQVGAGGHDGSGGRQSGHRRGHRPAGRRRTAARGARGDVRGARASWRACRCGTTGGSRTSGGRRGPPRRDRAMRWPRRRKGSARTRCRSTRIWTTAGRLRKVRHRFSFANGGHSGPVAQVVSTTLLSGFGAPVDRTCCRTIEDIYAGKIACPVAGGAVRGRRATERLGIRRGRKWSVRAMRGAWSAPYARKSATAGER